MAIATKEPTVIYAGDTLKFTKDLGDYLPEESWTLSYTLVNASGSYTFAATDNGDSTHLVNVAPATTGAWTTGDYTLYGHVTDGTDRYKVVEQEIEVKPNFASVNFDARSHVKKVLDALESTIEGKASQDQIQLQVAGRSIQHLSPTELIKWRETYKREYQQELKAAGLGKRGIVKVRFV